MWSSVVFASFRFEKVEYCVGRRYGSVSFHSVPYVHPAEAATQDVSQGPFSLVISPGNLSARVHFPTWTLLPSGEFFVLQWSGSDWNVNKRYEGQHEDCGTTRGVKHCGEAWGVRTARGREGSAGVRTNTRMVDNGEGLGVSIAGCLHKDVITDFWTSKIYRNPN